MWLKRRFQVCAVRNVTGSSPVLPTHVKQYHLPCTVWIHSLILSISSPLTAKFNNPWRPAEREKRRTTKIVEGMKYEGLRKYDYY